MPRLVTESVKSINISTLGLLTAPRWGEMLLRPARLRYIRPMKLASRLRRGLAAAVLITGGAGTANAQSHCQELKQHGDDAMEGLRYGDALVAYENAYECDPTPSLLYNQARSLEALWRFPETLAHYM